MKSDRLNDLRTGPWKAVSNFESEGDDNPQIGNWGLAKKNTMPNSNSVQNSIEEVGLAG